MLTSIKGVGKWLRQGWVLHRGSFCGWWLSAPNGSLKRKRVHPRTVDNLIREGIVVRTDDHTSRVGETWEMEK